MKNIITVLTFIAFTLPTGIKAGGWVGNGIGTNSSALDENSSNSSSSQTQNYFLLKPAEASLTLGVVWDNKIMVENRGQPTETRTSKSDTLAAILFSYGINENWTWSNIFSLRYNLHRSDRQDFALSFGPAEGEFGSDDYSGFYMSPGAGVYHSWKLGGGFRVTNHLSSSFRYQSRGDSEGSHLYFNDVHLTTALSLSLGDITIGVSGTSQAGYRRPIENGRVKKAWDWYLFAANPTVDISTRLGQSSEFGFGVLFPNHNFKDSDSVTSVLYLETRF